LLVGFYQSTPFGSCFNDTFVESLFDYQSSVEDSVVLVYDPIKTMQGNLSLKAYRLSESALKLCYKDFSPESIKKLGLTYSSLVEELPIIIHNSHLVNIMLCEIAVKQQHQQAGTKQRKALDTSSSGTLERSMRQLMTHVDQLNQEMNKYSRYVSTKQKQDAGRESYMAKRALENDARRARGEPALPIGDADEGASKLFKPIQPPTMLDGMLAASQIRAHLDHTINTAAQNLSRVFLSEAVIEEKKETKS